jgi:hypothetical protein
MKSVGTSVVPVGAKKCKPFIFEGRFVLPEQGFKFEVFVEKSCTKENDAIWKLVFDLYKENESEEFEQIVHVSFRSGTPEETLALKKMAVEGISEEAAEVLTDEVFPVAKEIAGRQPTDAEKAQLRAGFKKATTVVEI